MVDTVRAPGAIAIAPAVDGASQAGSHSQARGSRFAKALYAALKPPEIDNADASGDFENEEATKAPAKIAVLPNPKKAAAAVAGPGTGTR